MNREQIPQDLAELDPATLALVLRYFEPAIRDSERLDWMEKRLVGGALVSDDGKLWAISTEGFAPAPYLAEGHPWPPEVWEGVAWVDREQWQPNIREAIDDGQRRLEERVEQ